MKEKNSKKVSKVIIYTLLILSSIGLTSFTKTYSQFYEKNDNALTYTARLYNMYYEYSMDLTGANKDQAKFTFKFARNKATLDNTEQYEIVIPDKCTFDYISTPGNTKPINKDSHSHVITFDKNTNKDSVNLIRIACSVEENKDLKYNVNINETIGSKKFTYITYSYQNTYKNYIDQITKEDISKPVSGDDVYNSLIAYIKEYTAVTGYYDEVFDYISSVYNKDNIKDESNYNKLPGFTIEVNDTKTEYTFKILTNFIGYARSYVSKKINQGTEYMNIYFSTASNVELNDVFNNYLNWYVYPDNEQASQLVYNYILDNGGISSIISGDKKIVGMTITADGGIKIHKTLLHSMAATYKEQIPQIAFGTKSGMTTSFTNLLTSCYAELGTTVQGGIYNLIKNSIIKNSSGTDIRFKDYFMYKSSDSMYFVKVSSEKSGYNQFEINKLAFTAPTDMTITSSNTSDTEFVITIKHTTETSVNDIVTKLSEYFGVPTNDSNLKVITNTDTEYSVEYTITK